ncbi:MAG TPA: hypothetical protein VJ577_01825 [Burkholderiaceae bacterium]|nr:hypothetical protein [Burkholderiaceae bacterium]
MTQTLHYWIDDTEICRELPDADDQVLPGVPWGEPWVIFTPAYWLSQLWMSGLSDIPHSPYHACGTLDEELVFCMLGGYGITAELSTAAYDACRVAGLIAARESSIEKWTSVLQQPLDVNGRPVRYRYPSQKAKYLAGAMTYLRSHNIRLNNGRALRDDLLKIKGVGPKTAGWVARNFLDSDEVAILDIHLVRAGILCRLFTPEQRVERDYFEMESRFIDFCRALDARPAVLDCLIWDQMRSFGDAALRVVESICCEGGQQTVLPIQPTQLQLSMAS